MKNKVLIFFILIFTVNIFSQEKYSFNIRITDQDLVPRIISRTNEKVVLLSDDNQLNNLLQSYVTYDFSQTYSVSSNISLKQIYSFTTSDLSFMESLLNDFGDSFKDGEVIDEFLLSEVPPNDFGLALTQDNLSLINIEEAWGYTKGDGYVVGVSDNSFYLNEELVNKFVNQPSNTSSTGRSHGNQVSSFIGAETNNGVGLASVGYNLKMNGTRSGLNYVLNLVKNEGVRLVNCSWGNNSPYLNNQAMVDEIYDEGGIMVVAAGNGIGSANRCEPNCVSDTINDETYHYPSALNHVISVSSIHHNETVGIVDSHHRTSGVHTHNDRVDIVAPGYSVPYSHGGNSMEYGLGGGTSYASPHVAAVAGLMLSLKEDLSFEEVESILKISSHDVYDISENTQYLDKLGAGRLDAGKAVKMINDMASEDEFLEISDRDFYRFDFKINSAKNIKIKNQQFRDQSTVYFNASNKIVVEEGTLLSPSGDKSIRLRASSENQAFVSKQQSLLSKSKTTKELFNQIIGSYELDYIIDNGKKNQLLGDLKPELFFEKDDKNNESFNVKIKGYCNETDAIYKVEDNFIKVLYRGETSLRDCKDKLEFDHNLFKVLTGDIYLKTFADKLYYELTQEGMLVWLNENKKYFFKKFKESGDNSISEKAFTYLSESYGFSPNPIENQISFDVSNDKEFNVVIYDLFGSRVKELFVNEQLHTFDLSTLASGVYMITFVDNNGEIVKRMKLFKK